jgi:hypothetical protein
MIILVSNIIFSVKYTNKYNLHKEKKKGEGSN